MGSTGRAPRERAQLLVPRDVDQADIQARARLLGRGRHRAPPHATRRGAISSSNDEQVRWRVSRTAAVAFAAVALLVAVVTVVVGWLRSPQEAVLVPITPHAGQATGAGEVSSGPNAPGVTSTPPEVVVHVAGQVTNPGVVTLPAGSRVLDAVTAAGGALPEADVSAINLARPLVDGEQVFVPLPGEVSPLGQAPAGTNSGTAAGVLNLNTATAAELETLPGIGPVMAGRIIEWRTAHGRFTSVEELGEVSGIGPTLLGRLRDLVTV